MPGDHKAVRALLKVRGGAVRNRLDQEKDTWYAVQLCAMGKTYQEIADELNEKNPGYNISREAVRLDIERVLVEWKKENMENIDAYIAKDLARIEALEAQVMQDYMDSSSALRPNEYAVLMKRGMTMEEIDEWYKEHKMIRDPRFAETLLHLQQQRLRILGLDKGNDVPQQTIVNYNFNGYSDEELANMADRLQDNKLKELSTDEQ